MEHEENGWTPFKGGVIGMTIGVVVTIFVLVTFETDTTIPKRMRLNEPCHYGAKPMMVEDGNSAGKHRVVCGCPQ